MIRGLDGRGGLSNGRPPPPPPLPPLFTLRRPSPRRGQRCSAGAREGPIIADFLPPLWFGGSLHLILSHTRTHKWTHTLSKSQCPPPQPPHPPHRPPFTTLGLLRSSTGCWSGADKADALHGKLCPVLSLSTAGALHSKKELYLYTNRNRNISRVAQGAEPALQMFRDHRRDCF